MPGGVDGKIAATEFPKPNQTVAATVAGRNATILYAGAIPFQVAGLFQINIQLPADLPTGNHPVMVTIGNGGNHPFSFTGVERTRTAVGKNAGR